MTPENSELFNELLAAILIVFTFIVGICLAKSKRNDEAGYRVH